MTKMNLYVNIKGEFVLMNAFLVENADYSGYIELPVIKTSNLLPNKVVVFSRAMSEKWKDFDC